MVLVSHRKTEKINVAQVGTRHGHAASVLITILNNPLVNLKGLYEPNLEIRKSLRSKKDYPWDRINFFDSEDELYREDIVAVASEGANEESLQQTFDLLKNNKHVFYDKPAGENFSLFKKCVELADKKNLRLQLGYMFRNHPGFILIDKIVKSKRIGKIFSIRAHMSTNIEEQMRRQISVHRGGIFFDLAGHMLDQIVHLIGKPKNVTSFIRKDITDTPNFFDNTLCVFEYSDCLASIDIASGEPSPMARRFEVYGTEGSLIMEPFEPAQTVRINIPKEHPNELYIPLKNQPRYVDGFHNFIRSVKGEITPERTLEHELDVQETLLKAVELI